MDKDSKTILIVDDTVTNLDILIELLDQYDVIDATNGQDALEIVEEESVDLLLLDIMMPEMDGYEVCKRLKADKKTQDIPIIFITAKTDEDSIEKAYDTGGDDYVSKPFKPKELLARVKTQLYLKDFKEQEEKQKIVLQDKIAAALEEQKKINQMLVNKERLMLHQSRLAQMGEMVAMIAHQWRQPLNSISLTVNNLLIKCMVGNIEQEVFEAELKLIDNYSQYLSSTIDDFRGFFREDKVKELTTLTKIITSTLTIIKTSIENKRIKIIIDMDEDIEFTTYVNEVQQVILNLLKNAEDILIEREIQKPIIWINSTFKNKSLILTIKDNGGGIADNILTKVFEPYFSTKKDKNGTGLGLYMSKTIIDNHCNGKISVSNDKDGAIFKILFDIE